MTRRNILERFNLKGDKHIWFIVILLAVASLLMVYSSTSYLVHKNNTGFMFYALKHVAMISVGFFAMYKIHKINYMAIKKISNIALLVAFLLLFFTLIVGTDVNGARRWINIPFTNQTFQPSDFAKIALIIFLAKTLSEIQDSITKPKTLLFKILIPVILVFSLIVYSNISSAVLIFFNSLLIIIIGRAKLSHLFGVIFVGLVLMSGVFFINFGQRGATGISRIEHFFSKNQSVENFQANQARIAIIEGGIIGKGFQPSTLYIPHKYSDFIFAHIVEVSGFFGGLLVILLYVCLFWRCLLLSMKAKGAFACFLSIGIGFNIMSHALLNMGVSLGLLPVTGVTLPFLSMGGTSTIFFFTSMGIVLSVSRSIEPAKTAKESKKEDIRSAFYSPNVAE